MTNESVPSWLSTLGLPEYISLFNQHKLEDIPSVSLLKNEDLEAMGITKASHRKKIINGAAKRMRSKPLLVYTSLTLFRRQVEEKRNVDIKEEGNLGKEWRFRAPGLSD